MIQAKQWLQRVVLFVLPAALAVAMLHAAKTESLDATNSVEKYNAAVVSIIGQANSLSERLCELNPN